MKRLGIVALALLTIGVAWAAVSPTAIDYGARWSKSGIWIGTSATETATQAHRLAKRLGGSTDYDFPATSVGIATSWAVTVTGAAVGDTCTVSAPAAASALAASFSCVVTAANEVKIIFTPKSQQRGAATLVSGTPSQVVVAGITASSVCTATPVGLTALIAGAGVAVSLTTTNLTITGPDTVTTVINYDCVAPVDPADGGYAFELTRNGS